MLKIGRKGQPTRFEFDLDIARSFLNMRPTCEQAVGTETPTEETEDVSKTANSIVVDPKTNLTAQDTNRVFITHGKNKNILEQVKEIVTYGKFEPVVAMEHETSAKPVPQKVMSDMRTCRAAVINVSTDNVLYDNEGNEVPLINENVLIEIGAAMALYHDKFVLLAEEGLDIPSNLQGLYECRYKGDELNM